MDSFERLSRLLLAHIDGTVMLSTDLANQIKVYLREMMAQELMYAR